MCQTKILIVISARREEVIYQLLMMFQYSRHQISKDRKIRALLSYSLGNQVRLLIHVISQSIQDMAPKKIMRRVLLTSARPSNIIKLPKEQRKCCNLTRLKVFQLNKLTLVIKNKNKQLKWIQRLRSQYLHAEEKSTCKNKTYI